MTFLRALTPIRPMWTLAALIALVAAALVLAYSPAIAQSPPQLSVSNDGLATWSYTLPDGASFTYSEVRWKPYDSSEDLNDWSNRSSQVFWDAKAGRYQIPNLTPGVEYKAKVFVAVNQNGGTVYLKSSVERFSQPKSPPRVEPTATPKPILRPPARPGVITLSRSDGTLSAFWNSVGGATSYHVMYSGDNRKSWELAALNHPAGNGTTDITITGVDNNKPYIVGVRSRNSAGDSAWRESSGVGRYEPPRQAPRPPETPTRLSATGSDRSVTLRWNRPIGDITGYQFQFREAPPAPGWGDWYGVPDSDENTTSYTIHKLKNGTEYRFKLRAVNSGAASDPAPDFAPWYVSATPTSGISPPPAPKKPSAPPAPSSVTATRGDGTIVASWYHSDGATGYDVRYSSDNGKSWSWAAWHWRTSVITIKGASGSKSYIVGVRAVNLVGESGWTNSNTVAALPDPNFVSVSNLDEAQPGWQLVGQDWNSNTSNASGFTTGPNTDGYTLKSVTVRIVSVLGSPTGYTAAIHAANSGSPAATSTYTLIGDAPTGAGDYTYTCSGTCALEPGTKYFLVVSGTGDSSGRDLYEQRTTGANSETNVPSNAGWSIDDLLQKKTNNGPWTSAGVTNVLQFKVTATATPPPPPELTASGVSTSTATLTISNHGGNWYYKATTGPHATCQGPVSGTSVNLTGLTPGASYTYSAYKDSSCGNLLATETFTANRLTVSVSNLDKPIYQYSCVLNANAWCAVGFTTGTSTHGYTLTDVTAKFATSSDQNNNLGDIVVSLHSDNSGVPASATLATLSGDNPDTPGDYAYDCSGSGCALATSATYFIQFKATAGTDDTIEYYDLLTTDSNDETQTGNGWSLADVTDAYRGGSWITEYSDTPLIKLSATVNP